MQESGQKSRQIDEYPIYQCGSVYRLLHSEGMTAREIGQRLNVPWHDVEAMSNRWASHVLHQKNSPLQPQLTGLEGM